MEKKEDCEILSYDMESENMNEGNCVVQFEEVQLPQPDGTTIEQPQAHLTEQENAISGSPSEKQNEGSNKGPKPSAEATISFLKRKEHALSDDESGCNSIAIMGNKAGGKHAFEGLPEKKTSEIPEGVEVDKLTCPYCFKKYASAKKKTVHVKAVHNVFPTVTRDFIRCVECNISFKKTYNLRDHLRTVHNMKMDMQELTFPNMEAFLKWKNALERKEQTKYCNNQSRKKTKYGLKSIYTCHRSGKYIPRSKGKERTRRIKSDGSVKMGITCSAAIICEELPDEVNVLFCPYHYGHGKETTYRELTQVEMNAIEKNTSNGIDFDNMLGVMHEDATGFQASFIRRKDTKILNKAFSSEEYTSGLSDAEGVDRWVRICSQLEDSPVLYYRQEEEEFLLIIMTEFQRNLLLSSDKHVLCIDNAYRRNGGRFNLTCLMTLDECEVAFPVAFCISHKVDVSVVRQFLMSIRDATGQLSCHFFISDSESFYYESWQEVMEDNPKWIWSRWYVDGDLVRKLKPLKGQTAYRTDLYGAWKLLLEYQNIDIFETMFKSFTNKLCEDPALKKGADFLLRKYGTSKELWAYCYHKDVKLSSVMQFEILHRTMVYSCTRGRKGRLDKFIFVMLKLMKFKLLDRLTCMLDEEKTSLAVESINTHHITGFEIASDTISSLGDKIWVITSDDMEGNVYVVREFDSCPEHCDLKCSECDICIHLYSCTCIRNMIYADLCPHIHAVVWKFLTPHFSPLPSPAHDDQEDNMDVSSTPSQPPQLVDTVLNMTHDLFKKVRSNKSTLNEGVLNAMKYRINELMDMCSKNVVIDSQLNSNNVQVSSFQLNSNDVLNPNVTNTAPQTVGFQPQFIMSHQFGALPSNPTPPYFLILPSNINVENFVKR